MINMLESLSLCSWGYAVAIVELLGVILGAYGVLRESFRDLAADRSYGEGRYGEDSYGGQPGPVAKWLIKLAVPLRLLPSDHILTNTDQRRNAIMAIVGVIVVVIAMLVDVAIVKPICIP